MQTHLSAQSGLRHEARRRNRSDLAGIIGFGVHGVLFFVLAVVAVWYFGQIFLVVSAVMVAMSGFSLSEARRRLRDRSSGPS
ncbi:MAG: hypothetical protein ACREFQ_11440 [Stellaceae bacterium]